MGRIQEQNEPRMRGALRQQAGDAPITPLIVKTREKPDEKGKKDPKSPGGLKSPGGEDKSTPGRDRKNWSAAEEIALVKCLLEHKAEGRVIPLQSKTATYWSELITLLYPGDDGITQRRLYDKVRRLHHRYNECKDNLEEKKKNSRNLHESALFQYLEKLFKDMDSAPKTPKSATKQKQQQQQPKATNGNAVKVLQVSDSSSEEEEEDDQEEERAAAAQATPKPPTTSTAATAATPMEEASDSEGEEDEDEDEDEDDEDEDDSSPEKKRAVPSGPSGSRLEPAWVPPEEVRKASSAPREENPKASGKPISKVTGGNERKEKTAPKDRLQSADNGLERRVRGRIDHGQVDAEVVQTLKAELFQFVQDLRKDCMQQLDEVRNQLLNPARLKLARRRQELILEELSLQEEELEIGRRYCRLQKEALKLQNST